MNLESRLIYTYENGRTYAGEWIKGTNIREGEGTSVHPQGHMYIGEWRNNKMMGYGKYVWPDGVFYEGMWENSKRNGLGIMYYPPNTVGYRGYWKNGKPEGDFLPRREYSSYSSVIDFAEQPLREGEK